MSNINTNVLKCKDDVDFMDAALATLQDYLINA